MLIPDYSGSSIYLSYNYLQLHSLPLDPKQTEPGAKQQTAAAEGAFE